MSYKFFFLLNLIIFFSNYSVNGQTLGIENGWKGIKAFITNRLQVEKILGQPVSNDGEVKYVTEDEIILITYAPPPCSQRSKYKISEDTVMWYTVNFKKGINLKDLKWQKDLYFKVANPELLQRFFYGSKTGEVTVITQADINIDDEYVTEIKYEPTNALTKKFLCECER